MTGYDLHKEFKNSAAHFWPADQSQIYRTLADLEADQCIKSKLIPQAGKPEKREYTLLAKGKKEYLAWLASPLVDDAPREPFLLRLFFAEQLGTDGVRALIEERASSLERTLEILEGLNCEIEAQVPAEAKDLGFKLRMGTLEYGINYYKAEISWLHQFAKTL